MFTIYFFWLSPGDFLDLLDNIKWLGIKKILTWCLDLPLSLGLVAAGAVFGGMFYSIFSGKK
jgi:hypothetical protein